MIDAETTIAALWVRRSNLQRSLEVADGSDAVQLGAELVEVEQKLAKAVPRSGPEFLIKILLLRDAIDVPADDQCLGHLLDTLETAARSGTLT